MSTAFGRRGYTGGAAITTLASDITSGATSISAVLASSYPAANFHIVIDEGVAGFEEKIFCGTRTGNNFTSCLRAEDGTTAVAHVAGASIRHVLTAQDIDEANAVTSVLTTKGDLAVKKAGGATTGWDRLPVGANGTYLRGNSAAALGVEYSTDPLEVTDFAAKGDLIVATGNDAAAILTSGTQGQVLTVDTTQSTGMKYDYSVAVLTTAQRDALAGANLWRGRTIFNTDTGALEVYYGATTLWKPPWNTAWGLVTPIVTRSTSVIQGGAAFVQVVASAAFTMLANRLLEVSYNPAISGPSLSSTTVQVRRNIGGSVVGLFTQRRESASTAQSETFTHQETPPAGATSYEMGFIAGATSAWTDYGSVFSTSQLVIKDCGPNGNAPAS